MNQSNLWEPSRRIELNYKRALRKIARQLVLIAKGKSPEDIIQAVKEYAASQAFLNFAEKVAMRMVTGLFKDAGHSWREAAARNGRGRELYKALMKELKGGRGAHLDWLIRENTYRIVTLPEDIGKEVASYVERESLKGRRASDIEREIQRMFPRHTEAKAKLIARTQVSYTQTNLIRVRAEALGLNYYVWRCVGGGKGDGRTRHSHRKMEGVIVNWNDPPAPENLFPMLTKTGRPYRNTLGNYHAGQAPNCRCYPETIVDMEEVTWPARIYQNGRIFMINKQQFAKIMG